MSTNKCSLGHLPGVACHGNLTRRSDLSDDDCELLRRRTETKRIDAVCEKHRQTYLHFYPLRQSKCADIFEVHKKPIKDRLQELKLHVVRLAEQAHVTVKRPMVPGQKLCTNCHKLLSKLMKEQSASSSKDDQSVRYLLFFYYNY